MKNVCLFFIVFALFPACKDSYKPVEIPQELEEQILYIEADQNGGFSWPYYLYIPEVLSQAPTPILVMTNNCFSSDDYEIVLSEARSDLLQYRSYADAMGIPFLLAALPRYLHVFPSNSKGENDAWIVNVQALTRNAMLTNDPLLERIDLQVNNMILDATEQLKALSIETTGKAVMFGFSASGDFAMRYSVMHPESVEMLIAGDPSDWFILPLATFNGHELRYPIGIYDLHRLTGEAFDPQGYNALPKFFFTGTEDDHDPVIYIDNYDYEDRITLLKLFPSNTMERYRLNVEILEESNCQFEYREYPGVDHRISDDMKRDIIDFFHSQYE